MLHYAAFATPVEPPPPPAEATLAIIIKPRHYHLLSRHYVHYATKAATTCLMPPIAYIETPLDYAIYAIRHNI